MAFPLLLCHHASTKGKEKKGKGSFDFSLIPKGEGGEPRTAKGKRMNGLLCARLLLLQSGGERRESVGKVFWTPQGDASYVASIAGWGTPSLTGLEFTLE